MLYMGAVCAAPTPYPIVGSAERSRWDTMDDISFEQHSVAQRRYAEGNAHFAAGRIQEAVACYREALRGRPEMAEVLHNLGVCLRRLGQADAAMAAFRRSVELQPGVPDFLAQHGWSLHQRGRVEQAAECLMRAAVLRVSDADLYFNAGVLLKRVDRMYAAAEAFDRASSLRPGFLAAQFGRCMTQLPALYKDEAEITDARARYAGMLEAFIGSVSLETAEDVGRATHVVGAFQPYFLAYQEKPDRELQEPYGRFACDIMARRYPRWSVRPPVPPREADGALRIGIVSGFFRWHTIWKLFMRGWAAGLDRRRIRLHAYSLGDGKAPQRMRDGFHRFTDLSGEFETMASVIAGDRLHAILYPEIGMDPTTMRFATLRLAPLQCASWGHPDTTGLPSIDCFLTSDLMEPPEGERHYTERLVRLPGLGIHYPPLPAKAEAVDLTAYGVEPGDTLYLCCQYLSKYLPQYDRVFAKIARAVPRARFLFINPRADRRSAWFLERLRTAFAAEGLDAGAHVVMLPYLAPPAYRGLNERADVYLDSIGWSGGNTTLEALACGLPVVTLPGDLMRGRHSAAMLWQCGAADTVAANVDDYVAIAVRLGLDAEERQSLRGRILAGMERIYADLRPLRALEDFLEREVETLSRKAHSQE